MDNSRYSPRQKLLRAKIRSARKSVGLTQRQLAQLLGKQQSYISKIETGERKIEALELDILLGVMGVSHEVFFKDIKSELI